jgi:membrane protein DedA with SNARE-associated domain
MSFLFFAVFAALAEISLFVFIGYLIGRLIHRR